MGTALLARGLPAGALPEEWLRSRPEEIQAVHAAHAAAGAGLLLTCTFSAAAPRLEARVPRSALPGLCARAVDLARRAATPGAPPVLVAGAVGPTGLAPPLGPGGTQDALRDRYARALDALAAAGADLLWLESQWDLGEARAALAAARRTGLPAAVTFGWPERAGRLAPPDGSDPAAWLAAAADAGAAAVGVNCVFPGPALDALVAVAAPGLRVPVAVKPSPGLPGAVLAPEAFAARVAPALAAGARLAGGCCGAGPEHLAALGRALRAAWPAPPP